MIYTFHLSLLLNDAPWPMTKGELIDYVNRTSGNQTLLDSFANLVGNRREYDSIEEVWADNDPYASSPNGGGDYCSYAF